MTRVIFQNFEEALKKQLSNKKFIIIVDDTVFKIHENKFCKFDDKIITIPSGEKFKTLETVNEVYKQLIHLKADRSTFILGVGGGVTTDIVGYVAGTYMRGLKFGFVPTTLLAMVDASIGGKNGVDIGVYKNIVGLIIQPEFILLDINFLETLPQSEWSNGCAEIIKHAFIRSKDLFYKLNNHSIKDLQTRDDFLTDIINCSVNIKIGVVEQDPYEKQERRILNFGHTIGHAIENFYNLSHGNSVAIGMVLASKLSKLMLGFSDTHKLISILERYELPTSYDYDIEVIFSIIQLDKKREREFLHFILLKEIGDAQITKIELSDFYQCLKNNLTEKI